ncbi:hypothetical protein PR002_g32773, partial [Phytophthora rubi]
MCSSDRVPTVVKTTVAVLFFIGPVLVRMQVEMQDVYNAAG